MVTQTDKTEYWEIVKTCLLSFHGFTAKDAKRRVELLRKRVDSEAPGDLFYHSEPFSVACDIVGSDLDIEQFFAEYEAILAKHPATS